MPLSYLKWRLAERGRALPVYELGFDSLPVDMDAAVCLDAFGSERHPVEILRQLAELAPMVAVGVNSQSPDLVTELEALAAAGNAGRLVARHELPDGTILLVYRRTSDERQLAK